MSRRAPYELILIYGEFEKRVIPYNWKPSGSEVVDIIRRLRSQKGPVEVKSAALIEKTEAGGELVNSYVLPKSVRCVQQSESC